MQNTISNGYKKIAHNVIYLYSRLIVTLLGNLYLTRLTLQALDVESFGVYSLVYGLVLMLGFMSVTLSNSTQRFISFELGKKNGDVDALFSSSINIHCIVAVALIVIIYISGIFAIEYYLVLPQDLKAAAKIIFYVSLFSFFVSILSIPAYSALIAFEKMNLIAIASVSEVVLKVFFTLLIVHSEVSNTLIVYCVVIALSTIFSKLYIIIICYNKLNLNYSMKNGMGHIKNLLFFTGWNVFGSIAALVMNQGLNILINIFFGLKINAARAISIQVQSAVNQLASSFQLAFNPQIVKCYSSGRVEESLKIALFGSKYSFFLLLYASLPIFYFCDVFLGWWLPNVPEYTEIFVKLMMVNILINVLSEALITLVQATGDIKKYQILVGSLLIMNLPISYIVLYQGGAPEYTVYVSILISIVALMLRLYLIKNLIPEFSAISYLKLVIARAVAVVFVTVILYEQVKVNSFILDLGFLFFISFLSTLIVGLSTNEIKVLRLQIMKLLAK
jgi:O-antigen/teichoic acid export membrane protein